MGCIALLHWSIHRLCDEHDTNDHVIESERKGIQLSKPEDVVRYTEIVDVPPDVAVRVFVERFADWWPADYTFSADSLQYIGLEPAVRGRCLERDHDGTELVWGEVLAFEPPERIVFSWWIQPDRTIDTDSGRASEVVVRFIDERALTRVEFEHRNLSRHAGDWESMREALASRQGWPMLLQRYADLTNHH